jgi:hypothetical protein
LFGFFLANKIKSGVIIMNMRQRLLAGATVMLLASSPVWAVGGNNQDGDSQGGNNQGGNNQGGNNRAPEIDAASGTSAIALLTGVLLLAGERSRSRRS